MVSYFFLCIDNVDPDQRPRSVESEPDLHRLHMSTKQFSVKKVLTGSECLHIPNTVLRSKNV